MRDSDTSLALLLAFDGDCRLHVDDQFSQLSQLVERLGPATVVLPAHLKVPAVVSLFFAYTCGRSGVILLFFTWRTLTLPEYGSCLIGSFLSLFIKWHRTTMAFVLR